MKPGHYLSRIFIDNKKNITECRGATNPQSELGYIAPDSLYAFWQIMNPPNHTATNY